MLPIPKAYCENAQSTYPLGDMFIDYSKNTLGPMERELLNGLALETDIEGEREAMFEGRYINKTENRQVLHTAFRDRENKQTQKTLEKMHAVCNLIISGQWKGYTGKPITDIVNIGIGGSNLGPQMAVSALRYKKNHLNIHFLSNLDGHDMDRLLQKLPRDTCLFIVTSKTFTTLETLLNANWAKSWFGEKAPLSTLNKHFLAVTNQTLQACKFGLPRENIFELPTWVGGRFSLFSPVGLPVALAVGFHNFQELLKGAFEMDCHFRTASIENNIPIQGALLNFWYSTLLGYETYGIFPYDQRLEGFIPYLQQLIMESNGKSVDREGKEIHYQTAPIVWGGIGTNIQHSFFQLLHQGTKTIPCDFILVAKPDHENREHHDKLLANGLGQTRALLLGHDDQNPFKRVGGGRPSTTIILKKLSPKNLGMLTAYYEHQVFCLGHLQNIYSFDQWGVELGKTLAKEIYQEKQQHASFDASTARLLKVLEDFSS